MPELPEVEVSRLGLEPELTGRRITGAITRTPKLSSSAFSAGS